VPTATVAYSYEIQGLTDHSRPGRSLNLPAQTAPVQRRPRLRIAGYRRQRPLWGIEALTPAELRVARHAADGMSNPQIAALLFVTRGTVESQLHAVYRKLGIPGRLQLHAELAVLVSESA
jgi:DNA-binding CsgD family transcriptional regulator